MKRYIVIAQNENQSPAHRRTLIEELRSRGFNVIDVRVGSRHIEVDMLSQQPPSIDGLKVTEVVEVGPGCQESPYDCFRKAVRLFDSERFWEAHETLEGIWRTSKGVVKDFLHGLILTAAAFVHLQKGDERGFSSIVERATREFKNADVEVWGLSSRKILERLEEARETMKGFSLSSLFS
ncbi:MAG: DUF309 domain-containing protein [Candidatus Caldarchaeum sp.]|nr:DUF309 domain-containing protein [Candidatus Caldarchaeum sp.]